MAEIIASSSMMQDNADAPTAIQLCCKAAEVSDVWSSYIFWAIKLANAMMANIKPSPKGTIIQANLVPCNSG